MDRITTVIMARDEERSIARAIRSVRSLGPVIVADTGSTDRTREIAEAEGATVHAIEFCGFGPSKQTACNLATTEYVLSVDADEVVSDRLARQIRQSLASDGSVDGYFLPRVTDFCGSWVFHSGWYPEYVLRLFRPTSGRFTDDEVHESIICDGNTERLDGLFLHYSYPSIASYARKLDSYARLGAEKYCERNGRLSLIRMLVAPPVWFLKKFIVRLGFADGIAGLWIAVLTAFGQFLKYRYALGRRDA